MVRAENLHRYYSHTENRLEVLKGVDLAVKQGEILAIVGPSGAGKSTLLHILGGLDAPQEGRVSFGDQDIYRLNDKKRAALISERIGFIFQFYHLLPEFTALENVLLPGMVRANTSDPAALKERGLELLERVGLQHRVAHKPNELSGGEQQRVAIARALINQPQIVLCDEPTGNLDSASGTAVIDFLMEFNDKYQQTIVIVTHDDDVARRAHRIVHMKDGILAG